MSIGRILRMSHSCAIRAYWERIAYERLVRKTRILGAYCARATRAKYGQNLRKSGAFCLISGIFPKNHHFVGFFSVPGSILGVFRVYFGCIWVISDIFREIDPLFRDLCRANLQNRPVWDPSIKNRAPPCAYRA